MHPQLLGCLAAWVTVSPMFPHSGNETVEVLHPTEAFDHVPGQGLLANPMQGRFDHFKKDPPGPDAPVLVDQAQVRGSHVALRGGRAGSVLRRVGMWEKYGTLFCGIEHVWHPRSQDFRGCRCATGILHENGAHP